MKSPDKIAAQLDALPALRDRMVEHAPAMAAVVDGVLMMRGQLARQIPQDPAELDELLARGAQWFLELRSDDAVSL